MLVVLIHYSLMKFKSSITTESEVVQWIFLKKIQMTMLLSKWVLETLSYWPNCWELCKYVWQYFRKYFVLFKNKICEFSDLCPIQLKMPMFYSQLKIYKNIKYIHIHTHASFRITYIYVFAYNYTKSFSLSLDNAFCEFL